MGQQLVPNSRAPFTRHLLAEVDPRDATFRPVGWGITGAPPGLRWPQRYFRRIMAFRVECCTTQESRMRTVYAQKATTSSVCHTIAYRVQLRFRAWNQPLPRRCQPRYGWTQNVGRSGRVKAGNRETGEPEPVPATSGASPSASPMGSAVRRQVGRTGCTASVSVRRTESQDLQPDGRWRSATRRARQGRKSRRAGTRPCRAHLRHSARPGPAPGAAPAPQSCGVPK